MNQDDRDIDFISRQLKSAVPPWKDAELKVDLWPMMLRRMDEPVATFGWFESILVAAVALTFVLFPKLLPALLYHL